MKIVKKLIAAALALPVLAGLTACKDQFAEYSTAEALQSAQVYFSNENPSQINGTKTGSTFEVAVSRANAEGDITVPVVATCENENVTFPATVSFKDGETDAVLTCSYVADSLDYNEEVPVSLSIGGEGYTTPYGLSTYEFKFVIPMTWKSLGDATFEDNFMFANSHKVAVEKCEQNEHLYRLVDPYGIGADEDPEGYDNNGADEYVYFEIYKAGETFEYMAGETVEDVVLEKDLVYYDQINTGYYYESYDTNIGLVWPGMFKKYNSPEFWTYNTVLSWQDNGLPAQVQLAPWYYLIDVGGFSSWDCTQENGYVVITFPGVEISDYSCGVAYGGRFTDTEDVTSIVANVTLGSDVETAKAVIVEGKDPSAAVNGLASGEIEGQTVVEGSNNLAFEGTTSGNYTIVVVTFDENGEPMDYDYDTFKYTAPGASEPVETWTPIYYGTYQYVYAYCNEDGTPYDDEGLILSVCDQDENKYMISNVFGGVDFVFTMDPATGILDFDVQGTGDYYSNGEEIVIDNLANYEGQSDSYYSGGVFYFNTYYYISLGTFGYGYETFTLTGNYTAGMKANKVAAKPHVNKTPVRTPRRVNSSKSTLLQPSWVK